ncbi:hypothetical protein NFI96_003471 [Prochilodus magdalenae]|nr:hypothetical protein NFI96_003471 [Prochilodus magdalenae]
MVWGGISSEGRTSLHVLARGSLTAIRYRDEILRPLVISYAGAVGPGFLLMQDSARPRSYKMKALKLWTGPPVPQTRSIHQRHVAAQTVHELADALVQVWEEIPLETIRHLIRSMPRHCREVIQLPL